MDAKTADFTQLISQIGFPIVVCFWLMRRSDRREERMIKLLTIIAERLSLDPLGSEGDDS